MRVLGVFVGFEQFGLGQPSLHFLDATRQSAGVGIAVGDHVFHQHDIGIQVLDDGFFVQLDGATSSRALGRRVRQLKRLLHFQIRQAFDFQNTARELVDLASLGHRQQTLLDAVQRNRMYQITQGDAGLHLAFEAHQHRLGHVQRHHTGGSPKGHQTGTGRERNADGETGVRVATGAHGVGQQQTVEPRVDHAVTRTQCYAAAVADEGGQFAVGFHIHRLGISGCVAEGLHHHVGAEAQTRQVFQLVAGHRAGGVLRAHGGHFGFAVGAGANALAFRQANRTAHHFLRQREASFGGCGNRRQTEHGGSRQAQKLTRFGGE